MTIHNRCLTFLTALLVLGTSVLHAGANTNFRMSEIQKNKNQNAGAARGDILANRSGDRKTVIFRGTFDGDGTFVFQEDKIIYRNGSYNYPTNVTVGGRIWRNLDEPFELGFTPVFNSAELLEKEGRNADSIQLSKYEDHAELYLYDSASSSATYRISLAFDDESAIQRKKAEEQKKAETRRKAEERRKVSEDDGGEFFVSLPKKDKNAKNEKTAANVKREYGDNEKLQGVLYLLTPKTDNGSSARTADKESLRSSGPPELRNFVLGNWRQVSDATGNRHYPELDRFYDRQSAPSFSCFYQESVDWEKGVELLQCGDKVGEYGWAAVYSGYVRAPFSGKFRFLGIADDAMLVRFNRQIVIDYGWISLTTGISLDANFNKDFRSVLSGDPKTEADRRKIAESPLYSKYNLEVSYPSLFNDHGLAGSPVLSVEKGRVYPIDILLLEQCTNAFNMVLLVERLDSNGNSIGDSRAVSLFRTTPELPEIPSDSSLPKFNPDGTIWKVVDANGKPIRP